MLLEALARKQAAARLKLLSQKLDRMNAEKEMLEHYLATGEMRTYRRSISLRKNSLGKWAVQGHVKRYLGEEGVPVKASLIYEMLRQYDSSLKPATFRSHIKRLAENGVIERLGQRGCYRLVETGNDDGQEATSRKRSVVKYGYR